MRHRLEAPSNFFQQVRRLLVLVSPRADLVLASCRLAGARGADAVSGARRIRAGPSEQFGRTGLEMSSRRPDKPKIPRGGWKSRPLIPEFPWIKRPITAGGHPGFEKLPSRAVPIAETHGGPDDQSGPATGRITAPRPWILVALPLLASSCVVSEPGPYPRKTTPTTVR